MYKLHILHLTNLLTLTNQEFPLLLKFPYSPHAALDLCRYKIHVHVLQRHYTYFRVTMGSNNSHLRPQAISDLENHTEFSADEIRAHYHAFLKDCGHDPKMSLNLEEFKEAYKKHFPSGNPDSFAEQVFRKFDKDGSGRINFREFVTALSVQAKGSLDEKLTWAYELYDMDSSGFISRAEVKNMVQVRCFL